MLKRRASARRATQHESEVDVDQVALAVEQDVAVVPVLDPGIPQLSLSLYTILLCTILYGAWHKKRGGGGGSNIAQ